MTTYYLSSVDGDNASDGLSWANAFLTFKYAVETASAAASGPHILYVDSAHSESLAADTTITAAGDIRIFSVNRASGDALLAGAVVGAQATNYAITFNGAFKVYVYGITFQAGTGSANKTILVGSTDGGQFSLESCSFYPGTNASSSMRFGASAGGLNVFNSLLNCTIKYGATGQLCRMDATGEAINLTIDAAGSAPTNAFNIAGISAWKFSGCDLSKCTGNLVGDGTGSGTANFEFRQCKLGAGVTPMATQTLILNRGGTTITMYDCDAGTEDNNWNFFHQDPFGKTIAVESHYVSDGAQTASTAISYKVITTAYCSYYTPYVGPWIAKPHTGTSAVTASIEGLRVDTSTVIQDDEVWAEFQYKAAADSAKVTTVSDGMAVLGTAADQTSAKTYANWTGSPATDTADGVFKLASTFTPANPGHIYARVIVGEPSQDKLYYDPQIRIA